MITANYPMVMGVFERDPDSFHAESRTDLTGVLPVADRMLTEGATILDIGGASSRPGATETGPEEELRRLLPVIDAIKKAVSGCPPERGHVPCKSGEENC